MRFKNRLISLNNKFNKEIQKQKTPPPAPPKNNQQMGPHFKSNDKSISIKEAKYVDIDVKKIEKTHIVYFILLLATAVGVFKYTQHQTVVKPEIIYRDRIVYQTLKPESVARPSVQPAPQLDREPSSIANPVSKFSSDHYDKELIKQKIEEQYRKAHHEENNRFFSEKDAYRASHKQYYKDWEYEQLYIKHEKNELLLRGQRHKQLCEELKDPIYCGYAESFSKNKDKF